ncbi:MAG: hypothetical protein AABX98_01940 [Nanoarchaeota archaeon]
MKEKNERIILGLVYLCVFALFLITALFFKEYYWYYIISISIVSLILLTSYKVKTKEPNKI